MRTIKRFAFGGMLMAIIAFSSCTKNNLSPNAEETALATDNARMANEADNVGSIINAVAYSSNLSNIAEKTQGIGKVFGNITLPECATVTLDTVSNPKSITVDFGATPCLCDQWDGLYRQGIIKATWTGGFKDPGTVITTVTSNYYRGVSANEMDKYEINKTTTNMGLNQNNNPSFHVAGTVNITYFTGETANWNIDKIREWTQGVNTPDINDDVFLITGTVTGTNRNSIAVTSTTTTPLMRNSCNWFVSGVVEITRGNLPTMTVDFGNGNCDDQATVTVNGQTKTITLK